MADSRSGTRRNACKACTKAKRSCDRQRPCTRCADRLLECQYFPRPRRSENALLAPRSREPGLDQIFQIQPLAGVRRANHAALSQQNISALSHSPVALNVLNHNSIESQILTPRITVPCVEPELSWFLTQDSWEIKHASVTTPAPFASMFKGFVKTLQSCLQNWAVHGYNHFIHRQLYQSGLPRCLEDAYTTLVTYLAKTGETEDMVLQILENRATSLCQPSILLDGVETLSTKDHLARTQALLVYTLIRLFDGCPRQRALAEGSLSTLYQWSQQMRDSAAAEAPRLYDELGRLQRDGGGLEVAIWRAWILSESLRRTWAWVAGTVYIYQRKKDGWGGCSGSLMFTMRQGLWEAPNAWRWAQEARKQNPLFTQSINMVKLMDETPFAEVDSFTSQMLGCVFSPEQMDRWATRTVQAEG